MPAPDLRRVEDDAALGNSPLWCGEWSLATNFDATDEFLSMWADSQKKMYVMLNDHQVKKPPTVDRFTNQLNTVSESVDTFMNDRSAKQLTPSTAASGRPLFVQYVKILGA